MKERWSVHKSGNVVTEDRYIIGIPRTEESRDSAMANLVAAAPDMLEALEAVVAEWEEPRPSPRRERAVNDVVYNAIDKAKGEEE